ncbi:MAG: hypothetical protein V3W20_01525 [Candidatus Neomarinimicrobiota bacterium]
MNPKEILSKYAISPIVDIIYDYAYYCNCVGHPLASVYCDYCCKYSEITVCEITGFKCDGTNAKAPAASADSTYWRLCTPAVPLVGHGNTAIGRDALVSVKGGGYNMAVGYNAGNNITDGSFNICIGTTTTGIIGAGSSLGKSSSGNVCIANAGMPTDNCTVRIGNKRDHKDVFLPNRTHLDTLHFSEFIHSVIVSGDVVEIPLNKSLILIPLVGPFPLKKITLSFPEFGKDESGQILKIVFYDHHMGSAVQTMVNQIEFSKNVIKSSSFSSIITSTQSTEWYARAELNAWIKIG